MTNSVSLRKNYNLNFSLIRSFWSDRRTDIQHQTISFLDDGFATKTHSMTEIDEVIELRDEKKWKP